MAEAMATIATTTVITETTDHTIIAIITIIGQDITQIQGIIATIETMITIVILTKTKGKGITTEPIQIAEEKTEVGVEEVGKMYFLTRISRIKRI